MNSRRFLTIAALALAAVVSLPPSALAQRGNSRVFGDLLKRIPKETNALMLVNVEGLYDSPMGRRENWRAQAAENRPDRLSLSPDVTKLAVAMGMDFQTMQERWKIGMVQHKNAPGKLEALAIREGGFVETIEKMEVAWTPRGFDLFVFPDNITGFVSPTNRQAIVTWIKDAFDHPRNFPPGFADRAIFRADNGAQIVLALDLADAVSPKMIEPWLNSIEEVKKTKTEPKLLAPRLASVKSAFLVIRVDQSIEGQIRIEFDRPVDDTGQIGRQLILSVLEEYGADLPEMKTWSCGFDKKTAIEMSGRLSVESARKVISFANPPRLSSSYGDSPNPSSAAEPNAVKPVTKAEPKKANTPSSQPQNPGAVASQVYFRSVTSLIDALKQVDRPTYRSTKLWFDRYAKQIEELPILNVDKDLLDWGTMVSRTLREMASGVNYSAQNQNYTLAQDSYGNYGGYNTYYGNVYGGGSKRLDQALIKRQSDAQLSVDLDKRWQALANSAAETRRKMVEKYQVDF
jgi:hypothetical protein